jgi:hypothetical protein
VRGPGARAGINCEGGKPAKAPRPIAAPRLPAPPRGKPRVFPFGLAPALKASLDARWDARDGLYVFHKRTKGEFESTDLRCSSQRMPKRFSSLAHACHLIMGSAREELVEVDR